MQQFISAKNLTTIISIILRAQLPCHSLATLKKKASKAD